MTGGADGSIVVTQTTGSLTVDSAAPVSAAGSGNILLDASGALTLNADVASGSGNITLVAANGLSIGSGVSTITGAGDIFMDAGIGNGRISLIATLGNINVNSTVTQSGSGDILIGAYDGAILMNSVGRINTDSGLLDIRATGNITLSLVSSLTGDVFIKSEFESIRYLTGFAGANILSSTRAQIEVAKIAQFSVDATSVLVNDRVIFLGDSRDLILIQLYFG